MESQRNETRDKIVDGLNAVKNAAIAGVVPGGGAALLHASRVLEGLSGETLDENLGIKALALALKEPFKAILENAGLNSGFFAAKVLEEKDWRKGVCVRKGKVVDMAEEGVG